jgi:hypothetical protein
MNETDKVIICLGFFTLVGFIAYLYFMKVSPTGTLSQDNWVSVSELRKIKEERKNG